MGVIDEMYPMTQKYKACSTLFKLCQCIINTLKFHNSSKFQMTEHIFMQLVVHEHADFNFPKRDGRKA